MKKISSFVLLIFFVMLHGCLSLGYYSFLPGKEQTSKDNGEIGYQDINDCEIVVDLHKEKRALALHFGLKNNSKNKISIGLNDFIIKEINSDFALLTEPDGIYIQRRENVIDKKPVNEVTIDPKQDIEGYIYFKKYPIHPKIIMIVNGESYEFRFWQIGQ